MTIEISKQNIHQKGSIKSETRLSNSDQYIPEQMKEVARAQEKQFAEFMIRQMEKSIGKNSPDNTASEYYKSLLNSERASRMVESNGGLGLQKLILDQIYPQRLRNPITYNYFQKKMSPPSDTQKHIQKYEKIQLHGGKNE